MRCLVLSSKTSVYGNFVVKHQGEGFEKLKEGIDALMGIVTAQVDFLMLATTHDLDAKVSLVPSFHHYDTTNHKYYLKYEIKYPSILGIQDAIRIDD